MEAKGLDAIDSYFDIAIDDALLDGIWDAWCVDQDLRLNDNECFEASVYSSYEALPAGAFERPENFDQVNWLLNQEIVGKISSSGSAFTFGDVQRAIWYLIDDSNCVLCEDLGPYSDERALELMSYAMEYGEGFKPKAGQYLGIILIPTTSKQSLIIRYRLECEKEPTCETAYARGENGATCFDQYEFDRWGWTIGPISEGDYTYDVYAAAGQCDISKGTLVGTVNVSYAGGEISVEYNIDSAYSISEEHTYAGAGPIPVDGDGKPTVAPGQYYIEDNLSGEIYVILHTVVCGDYED